MVFPVDVVMVEQCLCVSPACTWAMFAGWLNLEELIVLAESMMRRDGRLRRTTIEELTAYLDSAREFTEAVFEETAAYRICFADMPIAGVRCV